jgi:hypothetical protein
MKYTRRDFIKIGSLVCFGSGIVSAFAKNTVGQKLFPPSSFSYNNNALSLQNADSFQKLVGTEFVIYTENSALTSVLSEIYISKSARRKSGGECFTLVFELPSDNFGQNTYKMFHPSIGVFDLLLVPEMSKKGTALFIAVINRI